MFSIFLTSLVLTGCISELDQVAGTGAVYETACSGEMEIREGEYFAQCSPPACDGRFRAGPVSHKVVAVDPGRKIVGQAVRVCIQDLAEASAMFQPTTAGEVVNDNAGSAEQVD